MAQVHLWDKQVDHSDYQVSTPTTHLCFCSWWTSFLMIYFELLSWSLKCLFGIVYASVKVYFFWLIDCSGLQETWLAFDYKLNLGGGCQIQSFAMVNHLVKGNKKSSPIIIIFSDHPFVVFPFPLIIQTFPLVLFPFVCFYWAAYLWLQSWLRGHEIMTMLLFFTLYLNFLV